MTDTLNVRCTSNGKCEQRARQRLNHLLTGGAGHSCSEGPGTTSGGQSNTGLPEDSGQKPSTEKYSRSGSTSKNSAGTRKKKAKAINIHALLGLLVRLHLHTRIVTWAPSGPMQASSTPTSGNSPLGQSRVTRVHDFRRSAQTANGKQHGLWHGARLALPASAFVGTGGTLF